jgi:hypothetical protein
MIRRHRPQREIAFSFDSFLDIVANVVGIIIRMILVVWVGARAWTSMHLQSHRPTPAEPVEQRQPADPLQDELESHRSELARAQNRLLEQLRQLDQTHDARSGAIEQLAALAVRRQALETERAALERQDRERGEQFRTASVSREELLQREQQLKEEIAALERQASPAQQIRYRVPVSRPIQTEELLFECQGGRVTFIDIGAFLEEVRRGLKDKGEQLRGRWEVEDLAGPIGPFRLHYTIERERGSGLPVPDAQANFRYGVTAWRLEPILPERGETLEKALAPGSQFRQVVDRSTPSTRL